MGKLLIIRDADFSANGIQLGESVDIANTLTLTRGYNMVGATGNGRLATEPNVDLSSYISQGYRVLVAKIKSPTVHNQCLQIQNASGTQTVRPSSAYTANDIAIDLDANLPYFRYSLSKVSGEYASATYSADSLAEIKLIKY